MQNKGPLTTEQDIYIFVSCFAINYLDVNL